MTHKCERKKIKSTWVRSRLVLHLQPPGEVIGHSMVWLCLAEIRKVFRGKQTIWVLLFPFRCMKLMLHSGFMIFEWLVGNRLLFWVNTGCRHMFGTVVRAVVGFKTNSDVVKAAQTFVQLLTGCLLLTMFRNICSTAFRPVSAAHLSPASCHCSAARSVTFDPRVRSRSPLCSPS